MNGLSVIPNLPGISGTCAFSGKSKRCFAQTISKGEGIVEKDHADRVHSSLGRCQIGADNAGNQKTDPDKQVFQHDVSGFGADDFRPGLILPQRIREDTLQLQEIRLLQDCQITDDAGDNGSQNRCNGIARNAQTGETNVIRFSPMPRRAPLRTTETLWNTIRPMMIRKKETE